ncbi:MAG: phosphatidylglycerol lysyltransferase domain-containing protein [Actinomyces sp.]|uniref:phosphatidylglycerol lysyltransferase domain-containing protein n=1 Tax=Actinomyces sp. TaxID=29317 RepID=UPI0026DCFBF8|nr:phosphatidylglycerol lysyltransferase domain-containing protein [Actinomyces sp.]MDO4243396.1 phosphatidylglycerol lysyltransferase domain-containing protein [Actinomyces sp.]
MREHDPLIVGVLPRCLYGVALLALAYSLLGAVPGVEAVLDFLLVWIIPLPFVDWLSAVVALILAAGLERRRRAAWVAMTGLVALALVLFGLVLLAVLVNPDLPGVGAERYALVLNIAVLLGLLMAMAVYRRAYPVRSRPGHIRRALGIFLLVSGAVTALVVALTFVLSCVGARPLIDVLVGASNHAWLRSLLGLGWAAGVLAFFCSVMRSQQEAGRMTLEEERRVRGLLAQFPTDSLGYFGTRRDKSALLTEHGGVTYRVEQGVALASGDPLGDPSTWPTAERGFSMALGRLADPSDGHCVMVEALFPDGDGRGRVAALLSFAPWGGDGLSLDVMRRHPRADNGVTELMVATVVAEGADLGITRISLNFAVFRSAFAEGARLGTGPLRRLWRRVLLLASRWWQLESLYRSNAKYDPQWHPRLICYHDGGDLPQVALAMGLAEGFVTLPRWMAGDSGPQPRRGEQDAAELLAVGVGTALDVVFNLPCAESRDPLCAATPSLTRHPHEACSVPVSVSLVATIGLSAVGLASRGGWRGPARLTAGLAVVVAVLMAATVVLPSWAPGTQGPVQAIQVVLCSGWIALLAWRIPGRSHA